jgi:hypothetical protein
MHYYFEESATTFLKNSDIPFYPGNGTSNSFRKFVHMCQKHGVTFQTAILSVPKRKPYSELLRCAAVSMRSNWRNTAGVITIPSQNAFSGVHTESATVLKHIAVTVSELPDKKHIS